MYSNTHPTTVFKYCPRCGSKEFPTTGPRSFKCGTCGFVFYINASAAVAAVIFKPDGKMMFTRRAVDPDKGKLDLPGGFVDPMETVEAAVTREIQEELGATVRSLKYLCSFPNEYIFSGLSVFTIDFAFLTEIDRFEDLQAMDDISAIEYYYPEEVNMDELPSVSMRNILLEVLKMKRQ